MRVIRRAALVAVAMLSLAANADAQGSGAATLGPLVRGLGVTMRVLVIGAHPDDEDTQLIAWLAKGQHVETAYLSLTRGDGGQNLLGNELGEALGAIRTEELLAARRLDGGRQYFTRAYDFGFSKSAQEAFTQWPHDSVLRDVVTVVRAFRPQVIVSVFSGTPRDGHGQHQVAGIVAREAYDLAGDAVRFPRRATAGLDPWTVSKFYRGAGFRATTGTINIDVGTFDPILGRSYSEIAADSRSQHKSQAMGSLQRKGPRMDALNREATRVAAPSDPKAETSLFDGIDTTWSRFRTTVVSAEGRHALGALDAAFTDARTTLDLFNPSTVVPVLARIARLLETICPTAEDSASCYQQATDARGQRLPVEPDLAATVEVASRRVNQALLVASGIAVEATADHEVWALGEDVPVNVAVYNRGRLPVTLDAMTVDVGGAATAVSELAGRMLSHDSVWTSKAALRLKVPTQPWWLVTPRQGSMFTPPVLGIAEGDRPPAASVSIELSIDSSIVHAEVPVVYRYADPLRGEINRPIAGAPAVAVEVEHTVEYAPANAPIQRPMQVTVRSASSAERTVGLSLALPSGLVADSASQTISLLPGAQRVVTFAVRGRLPAGRQAIHAQATSDGQTFASGYTTVAYEHIRTQRLYRPSTVALEAVDVTIPRGMTVAYLNGVGDNSAPMLEQLGATVTVLDPASIPGTDLSKFSAVVVGTRAYEASDALVANNARLLDYARNGGTLVVQYGQYEMQNPGMMPYPITLARPADRVTVENAPVHILDPSSSVLTTPNRITTADFSGWQQDLTLYMPHTFDPAYTPLLEVHDPGEPENRGALLVAPLGRGTYVYTTLAFFRQLPNGNPGAARLFVNLMAAKLPPRVQ